MNYEEARQSASSVQPNPYTVAPCAWPDFDWPLFDPTKGLTGGLENIKPTGRERCDHDKREEAEQHHYDHELAQVRVEHLDLNTIRERRRCDVPACENWERYRAHWPGGYLVDSLCAQHAGTDEVTGKAGPELVHPFVLGVREIHS